MSDCKCDLSGEDEACIDGRVYVPCGEANCGGVCEMGRECAHECHAERDATVALMAVGELSELEATRIARTALVEFDLKAQGDS